jgi:hypothetical protein
MEPANQRQHAAAVPRDRMARADDSLQARLDRHMETPSSRTPPSTANDVQLTGETRCWYGSSSSLHSSAVSVTSVDFAAELSWSRSVAPMMGAPM